MRTISLKLLALLLFFGVAFTSCDDDDDNIITGLEDRNIKIDDTQTFNMKNFIASFEQLFESRERWAWDFTHEIVEGKALVTYQNYKPHGEFSERVFKVTHHFNTEGVIESSTKKFGYVFGWDSEDSEVTLAYTYDTGGYIVGLIETGRIYVDKPVKNVSAKISADDEEEIDVVALVYNNEKQLISKLHEGDDTSTKGNEPWEEHFEYNANGQVSKYTNTNWGSNQYYEYIYDANGNMTTYKRYYDGALDDTRINQFDNEGRLVKYYYDYNINYFTTYEYFDDYFRRIRYQDYNGGSRLSYMYDYEKFEIRIKYWDFEYDGDVFEYCNTKEYFYVEGYYNSLVSKKEYFEGTPENLVLVGYVVVDTRDATNEYKKTKESIYDANGTLLYYITYEVSDNSIQSHQVYLPDGTAISDYAIDYDYFWIHKLVSNLKID